MQRLALRLASLGGCCLVGALVRRVVLLLHSMDLDLAVDMSHRLERDFNYSHSNQ